MNPEKALITAKELQLERSGEQPVVFHGYSMWPFLREGDSLVIAPVRFEDVRVGDIVTFRKSDRFPTYRVLAKSATALTLLGDNWPDRPVEASADDVLGRAVARERGGKRLTSDSWRWRLVAFLRSTGVARRNRRGIAWLVRSLLGFRPE
jgi:hypothetical protein